MSSWLCIATSQIVIGRGHFARGSSASVSVSRRITGSLLGIAINLLHSSMTHRILRRRRTSSWMTSSFVDTFLRPSMR